MSIDVRGGRGYYTQTTTTMAPKKKEDCTAVNERLDIMEAKARLAAKPGESLYVEPRLRSARKLPWYINSSLRRWVNDLIADCNASLTDSALIGDRHRTGIARVVAHCVNSGWEFTSAIALVSNVRWRLPIYEGRSASASSGIIHRGVKASRAFREAIDLTNPHARKESGI